MPLYRIKREKGSAVLEFGIIICVLVPLMFGTIGFGVNLGNMLQAAQISRDIAHMYAKDVDFSVAANKTLAINLVHGLGGLTPTDNGHGVLILSQIRQVYLAECAVPSDCANHDLRVFSQRIVIGNAAERLSNFGTPSGACLVTSDGNISSTYYLKQAGCQASNFDTIMPQALGDVAYVVEAYFGTPDLSFLNASWSGNGSTATGGTAGTYMRAIF